MKSLKFLVTICFVISFTNCEENFSHYDLKETYINEKTILNLVNKTNGTFTPLAVNISKIDIDIELDIEESLQSNEERGKLCLKNITKCMDNDLEYESTANSLSKVLFSSLPPFDLSQFKGISPACQADSKKYLQDLAKFKMWALKMYDSTGKLPSGLLNGNINQLGDFDICLDANSVENQIYGQYCLASMQIESPHSPYMSAIHRLIQSHFHFKSKLTDPGHRVPRFSSINWALCVPSSCTPKDVETGFKRTVNKFFRNTGLRAEFSMDPAMCQSSQTRKGLSSIPDSTWIAISVFGAMIVTVLFSTMYDFYSVQDIKNEWIMAFSLRKNVNSMISMKKVSNDLEAVHGIRCINAVLLMFAHKSMAVFFLPWVNRTEFAESIAQPWSVLGRAASLYTDPFIMLSATLTTYSLLGRLQKTQTFNITQEYASRLLRIVPTFAAVIAFCTFILPWLNNGPMWNLVVTYHSDICKKNWWRNLLFIHNYYGFEEMCLTHTHHIGIDTQLFFASPFLIYLLWRWPKKGAYSLIGLATISTAMRYYVTYTMRLSNYVHFGTSIKQLFETADNMYILPAHRATVYIMGIFLGYFLRYYRNTTLSNTQLHIGNAVAIFSFLSSYFGPAFMGSIDYVYNPTDAAWYAAFAPILWCFAFGWIVFTTHIGYISFVGKIFSLPVFSLWTKISYTVYLTQFPAYFYNIGITRTPESYEFFRTMLNIKEYTWIIGLSVALTLLFESPFVNIRNIIFKKRPRRISNTETKTKVS